MKRRNRRPLVVVGPWTLLGVFGFSGSQSYDAIATMSLGLRHSCSIAHMQGREDFTGNCERAPTGEPLCCSTDPVQEPSLRPSVLGARFRLWTLLGVPRCEGDRSARNRRL
jgi:hypothetical protein